MNRTTTDIVRDYLRAKQMIDAANEMLKTIEPELQNKMEEEGIKKLEQDGHTVTLIKGKRRSFDVETLKHLVSPTVFKSVTKVEVKAALIDAAIALGKIDAETMQVVTKETEYTQIRSN